MPIDPSIPLRVQGTNIGDIAVQYMQLRRQGQQQEAQNRRQDALLQLQQDKAQREQDEFARKEGIREAATFYQSLEPLYEKGDIEGITQALQRKAQESDNVGFPQALQLHQRDPQQARSIMRQSVRQAQFEKLVAGPTSGFAKPSAKDFTQESRRVFERTGRQSDLVRTGATSGLDKIPSVSQLTKLAGPKGEKPGLGKTIRELRDEGFKPKSKLSKKQAASLKGVKATLNKLEELAKTTFTAQPGVKSRVWDDVKKTWGRLAQDDKDLVLYESFSQGTVAQLVRAAGEKGALSNKDIERGINLIPSTGRGATSLPDTREVALDKLTQLRQWFDEIAGEAPKQSASDLSDEELLQGF